MGLKKTKAQRQSQFEIFWRACVSERERQCVRESGRSHCVYEEQNNVGC